MKKIILLLFLILYACSLFSHEEKSIDEVSPLLVVVLMVKDEESVVMPTLASYVASGINDFFIFDTGSTDKTIEVTCNYFKDKKLSMYIAQEPFIDFAISRNRALELAKQKFPYAGFFLMPDAEWYLRNGEKLLEFCRNHINDNPPGAAYLMRIFNKQLDFYTTRLIRATLQGSFNGIVHETFSPTLLIRVPEAYFDLAPTCGGIEKSSRRWSRDRELLLKKVTEDPTDFRSIFYLAQTYQALGEFEKSYQYYKMRSSLPQYPEENFIARYRLGQVIEAMIAVNHPHFSWNDALQAYLDAYRMRPHRIEPLMRIAQHYLREHAMPLAYEFVLRANAVPYPEKDLLFVEKEIYEYVRYEMLSRCAWYMHEYKMGLKAAHIAQSSHPARVFLERRIGMYQQEEIRRNYYDSL